MSFDRKPEIFEEVDDVLFDRLPPNYRLAEVGSPLGTHLDMCDYYGTTMNLDPFHRPITKTLTKPRNES